MLEWESLPRMMTITGTPLCYALSITKTMEVKNSPVSK